MKKTVSLFLIPALVLGLIVALSGCGGIVPSDEILSQIVAEAVLSDNANVYLDGECSGEGHKILGSSLSGNSLKVYALTMYGEYGFRNDMFIKVSGSGIIPAVLTFEANSAGYQLKEIEYPRDGAGYTDSIKRMFPLRYRGAALQPGDTVYSDMVSQERRYAEEYLEEIGRDAQIGEYADLHTVLLTDLGISVEVSNLLCCDKRLGEYPYWIGTIETLRNGSRYVYSLSYNEQEGRIIYTTYEKETGEVTETFVFDAITGEELQ